MSENGIAPKYLLLRALADVQARQVRFLVPGLIPIRALTLVAGVGGLGKSTWLAGIAARVSRGELGEAGSVIIVSYEDTSEEMLRPRVEAAGGDVSRVFDILVPDHQGPVVLPSDLSELRACVRDAQAKLLIVDPIVAGIDVAFDTHKDQHVRLVLAELAALAEEEDMAIALVGHLNKAPSREAYIRVANSVAFWNAARSVVLVTEDAEEPDSHRLVAQRKANFARLAPIERHRIEPIVLPAALDPDTGDPVETSRMVFVEYADDVDADDLLGPRERKDEKTATAMQFLGEALVDGKWHDSAGLKKLAASLGVKERTLQLAANELSVEHKREGFPSSTWWRLPHSRNSLPQESCATSETPFPSGFGSGQDSSRAVAHVDLGTAPLAELQERFGE
jgi:archaellum biogenesis ATPase FlaH